jgi:hypothetical protein
MLCELLHKKILSLFFQIVTRTELPDVQLLQMNQHNGLYSQSSSLEASGYPQIVLLTKQMHLFPAHAARNSQPDRRPVFQQTAGRACARSALLPIFHMHCADTQLTSFCAADK